MVIILWIYLGALLAYGIYWGRKGRDYVSFVIGGRRQSGVITFLSLMATMIGGSATFGIAATGYTLGFPVFWWLGVGVIGLFLQSFFVSASVRELGARTLAEVGGKTVGEHAARLISVIIAVSWIGIIAGQFVALAQIFSFITGSVHNVPLIIAAAATVVLFTAAGGQISVMRTDSVYFFFILFGVAAAFFCLFFGGDTGKPFILSEQVQWFNDGFGGKDLLSLLFVVGGAYFIGPDVLSRSMAAKDGKTAKRASLSAAFILLFFNLLIVAVILWTKLNVADLKGLNPLIYLMKYPLPRPVALLLALGLISALLSSASTCLITAAATIQNDILRRENIIGIRLLTVLIGGFAMFIGLKNSDIITILTGAYSIYAPGLVFPLFLAIRIGNRRRIKEPVWLAAVAVGGTCGILDKFISVPFLPLIGMALSLLIAALSVNRSTDGIRGTDGKTK